MKFEKKLGSMEATRGFIQVPKADYEATLEPGPLPLRLEEEKHQARLDSYRRIWAKALKGRFQEGALVQVSLDLEGVKVQTKEGGP